MRQVRRQLLQQQLKAFRPPIQGMPGGPCRLPAAPAVFINISRLSYLHLVGSTTRQKRCQEALGAASRSSLWRMTSLTSHPALLGFQAPQSHHLHGFRAQVQALDLET